MSGIGFTLLGSDGNARRGRVTTAHGTIETPAFMPVGTQATVKAMTPDDVRATGAEIVLANTYHLMLRPGVDRIERLGGLHTFMAWPRPILTDSGGYQVMSLGALRKMSETGVVFRSHIDGAMLELTPEIAVDVQRRLGSDITMVLDECTSYPVAKDEAARSLALTTRWAKRSRQAFVERDGYGLFGIVQGSVFDDLRQESAEALIAIGFDGYAIGGLAVGEEQDVMFTVLDATTPRLPADRPRYLMGVGRPEDLIGAVERGVDMFDCVLPTRSGRTGQAFTPRGTVNLRNARHADDPRPLDAHCACVACRQFSRGYLHHVVKAGEIIASMLLTSHNLAYYQTLMRGLRDAIAAGRFQAFASEARAGLAQGDIAAV
ncbi:MAG: tRNA guanosine(34) transglycosylase Tgt [Rhodospirillales bacterium]|nr:tRNA guanosine(34) transglycosylase Tgt [Rhodospirillales bacterium]